MPHEGNCVKSSLGSECSNMDSTFWFHSRYELVSAPIETGLCTSSLFGPRDISVASLAIDTWPDAFDASTSTDDATDDDRDLDVDGKRSAANGDGDFDVGVPDVGDFDFKFGERDLKFSPNVGDFDIFFSDVDVKGLWDRWSVDGDDCSTESFSEDFVRLNCHTIMWLSWSWSEPSSTFGNKW